MENFIFQNPTKLVFGKGTIARLGELIPAGKRVMVTFGGGSVRRNGVYDEVCAALAGRDTVEFWGIEPNPSIETLREAIALGKEREVDFLLAVGGGSVIDGTKLIAAGLLYDGDAWELVRKGASQRTVPLGTDDPGHRLGDEQRRRHLAPRDEGEISFLRQLPALFDTRSRKDLHAAPAAGGQCPHDHSGL